MERRGFLGILLGGAAAATGRVAVPTLEGQKMGTRNRRMSAASSRRNATGSDYLRQAAVDFARDLRVRLLAEMGTTTTFVLVDSGSLGVGGMVYHIRMSLPVREVSANTSMEVAQDIARKVIEAKATRFGTLPFLDLGCTSATCVDTKYGISVRVVEIYDLYSDQVERNYDVLVG